MGNPVNDRLKRNPVEGGLFLVALIALSGAFWLKIMEPERSFAAILFDAGFWLVILLLGVPMFALYYAVARRTHP